jgi:hypothetical protein
MVRGAVVQRRNPGVVRIIRIEPKILNGAQKDDRVGEENPTRNMLSALAEKRL